MSYQCPNFEVKPKLSLYYDQRPAINCGNCSKWDGQKCKEEHLLSR